jgi:hypothetical protein
MSFVAVLDPRVNLLKNNRVERILKDYMVIKEPSDWTV